MHPSIVVQPLTYLIRVRQYFKLYYTFMPIVDNFLSRFYKRNRFLCLLGYLSF